MAKRASRRMSRKMRVPRNISDGETTRNQPRVLTHSFNRVVNVGTLASPAADGGAGRYFTLNSLPNYTEFTTLYNQYRIRRVDLIYEFTTQILGGTKPYPRLSFAVDYNDATTPTVENDVLQYENCEIFQFGQTNHTYKRSLVPRAALAAYQGTFAGYTTAPANTWFDCDNAGVQYYGIKEWVSNYNSTLASNALIVLYVRYHVEFKATR